MLTITTSDSAWKKIEQLEDGTYAQVDVDMKLNSCLTISDENKQNDMYKYYIVFSLLWSYDLYDKVSFNSLLSYIAHYDSEIS